MGPVGIPITWVDAFSEGLGGGNPAAVCLLDEPLDDDRMRALATELGISETAYLTPTGDPLQFGLRWFSPATEIDLCGHATLASAHALRQSGRIDGSRPLTFHTRSGALSASFEETGSSSTSRPTRSRSAPCPPRSGHSRPTTWSSRG